jgi:dTMP kinase
VTRGAFITLEGAEGVGKSTSVDTVKRTLERHGISAVLTREPGGTPLGERIRDWILHGDHGALPVQVEVLLMFAARAEHLESVIRPALESGRWVVSDRFTDATFAYQGGGRGASESFLESLTAAVQGTLRPDLTLLLDAPVDVSLARIEGRGHDHFEREPAAFFERVRQTYLTIARREPGRISVIDASQPLESVHEDITRRLESFCEAFGAST